MQDERHEHQLQHQQLQHAIQPQQQVAQDLIVPNHPSLDMSFTMLDGSMASSFSMPQSAPVDMQQHIMWDGSTPFLPDTSIFGTGADIEAISAGAFDDFDSWMRSHEGQFVATPNPNQALGPSPSLSFGPLGQDQLPQPAQQNQSTQALTQKPDTGVQPKPARKERPLAPKPTASTTKTTYVDQRSLGSTLPAGAGTMEGDNTISGITSQPESEHWHPRPSTAQTTAGGAHLDTDPANLLDPSQVNRKNHRRNRSSLDAASMFVPASSSPLGRTPTLVSAPADLASLRMTQRLQSRKGKAYHQQRRASPEKPDVRPGLSRSMSENRGARNGRGPASFSSGRRLPYSASSNGSIVEVNRSSFSGGSARIARSGRTSPLKHQKRLSELSSVREIPQFQEKIRLAVNERGFAHPELILSTGQLPKPDESCSSESESDESDDEPIMLPSRNSSFALKDSRKPVGGLYHSSRRSLGGSSSSNTNMEIDLGLIGDVNDDSEAETVTDAHLGSGGDASSALKDLAFQRGQQRSRGSLSARQARTFRDPFQDTSMSLTLDDEPYMETGGGLVQCVCQNASRGPGAGAFMVQCQCCENWLHGDCINITRSTRPSVYICSFCADTGFGRANPRQSAGLPRAQGIASSPLTKKSMRSFR